MANSYISYPYPVLGNQDDYPDSVFVIESVDDPVVTNIITKFNFSVKVTNSFLVEELSKGNISLVAEVSCKDTYFKETFVYQTADCKVELPTKNIKGVVSISTWLVANQDIPALLPSGVHPHYGSRTFSIEKGDILGEGQSFWFMVDDEPAENNKSKSSFIVVGRGPDGAGPAEVSFNEEAGKIVISLRSEDYDLYNSVSRDPDAKKITHAGLILPVLVQALLAFKDPENYYEYSNPNLEQYLKLNNVVELDDPFAVAQEILKYPISRMLAGAYAPLTKSPDQDEDD